MVGHQLPEGFEGQLAQRLALPEEPLLEGGRLDAEPGEEVAAVERGRLLEGRRGAVGHGGLEGVDVDRHGARVEGERVAVLEERRDRARGKGAPELQEGLAEPVPGAVGGGVVPEEDGELVAGVGLSGVASEVGEEGLHLAGRQEDPLAIRPAGIDPAEETQVKRAG